MSDPELFHGQARLYRFLDRRLEAGRATGEFVGVDGREFIGAGRFAHLLVGELAELEGAWKGDRLDVARAEPWHLGSLDSDEDFVAGTLHVGRAGAAALAAAVGPDDPLVATIAKDPRRWLRRLPLEDQPLTEAVGSWTDRLSQRELRQLLDRCERRQLLPHIVATLGCGAIRKIRGDPLMLCERFAIPVATLMSLQDELGPIDPAGARQATIIEALRHTLTAGGHTGLEVPALLANARRRDAAVTEQDLDALVRAGKVAIHDDVAQATLLASQERELARRLWELASRRGRLPRGPSTDHRGLSVEQQRAIDAVWARRLTVVTGGPGTGKSTLVAAIVKTAEAARARVELCAPTGKAAERLHQVTRHAASTIHSLVGLPIREPDKRPYDLITANDRVLRELDPAEHPAHVLVVDEASMLDCELALALLTRVGARTHLVLIGDVDQLPPVGGAGAVLEDIVAMNLNVIRLTQVFRQNAGSGIPVAAAAVLDGHQPEDATHTSKDLFLRPQNTETEVIDAAVTIATHKFPQMLGLDPIRDVQVLAADNDECRTLNLRLQATLNPAGTPLSRARVNPNAKHLPLRVGDKVRFTANSSGLGVVNGTPGLIESADPESIHVRLLQDDRVVTVPRARRALLELAYALTVHRAQGSEYPGVIVVTSHPSRILSRSWLYTAITRSQRACLIIAQPRALAAALVGSRGGARQTTLRARLSEHAQPTTRTLRIRARTPAIAEPTPTTPRPTPAPRTASGLRALFRRRTR